LQHQYNNVLGRVHEANRSYADPRYKNRFTIVEGLAHAGAGNYDQADTVLTSFITSYPTDTLRIWADAALEYIRRNRPKKPIDTSLKISAQPPQGNSNNTASNNAPLPLQPPLENKVIPNAETLANAPKSYTYNPQEEHYVIVAIPAMDQRAMGMKVGIGDFNTFRFGTQNLKTDASMLSPTQGIIFTKSFKALAQAKIYMNVLGATSQIFREYRNNEYEIMMISANNFLKLLTDKDLKPYTAFYKANYK
jgi:hypothetical protein